VETLVTPGGDPADIDVEMVPVIRALWSAGFKTVSCCQDAGESGGRISRRSRQLWTGYALIELPPDDALVLIDGVKGTLQFRKRMHWADSGAWEMHMPVLPYMPPEEFAGVYPSVQIRFPKDQLEDLAEVIRTEWRPAALGARSTR
jgi:hypothetical protein